MYEMVKYLILLRMQAVQKPLLWLFKLVSGQIKHPSKVHRRLIDGVYRPDLTVFCLVVRHSVDNNNNSNKRR